MPAVFTDTGLALMAAADLAGGDDVVITEVRVGTLQAGDRYDAVATQTALVDATPTVLTGADINLTGSGPRVNYNVSIDSAPALTGSEVGFFTAAGELVIVWADQADDVFTKAADARALIAVVYEYTNGVATGLSVTLAANNFASQDEAEAGTSDTVIMSPLKTQQWWNALAFPFTKLASLVANQTEAEAGTTNVKLMTPLRTQQWWDALTFPFSKVLGLVANQTEAEAGTTNVKLMTPLRVAQWWSNLAFPFTKLASLVANRTEAEAGSSNVKLMTPLRTKQQVDTRLPGKVIVSTSEAPSMANDPQWANGDIWFQREA